MKNYAVLITLITLSSGLPVTAEQQRFEQWRIAHETRFSDFKDAYQQRYEAYIERVGQYWGVAGKVSDNSSIVRYSDDLQHRVIINYENHQISLEHIDNVIPDKESLYQSLVGLQSLTVAQAAAEDPVIQANIQESQQSLLGTFSDASLDFLINEGDLDSSEYLISMPVDQAGDPAEKRINRITLTLRQDDIFLKRAQQYHQPVEEMSLQFNIEPELIYAIMQVESSFNPLAQSHIPAFGLMQIVPTSAGLDVNRNLYQLNQPPTSDELLQINPNIKFGTSFLNIISTQYLRGIENSQSRLLCTIAAYNTGVGNVASVFHPDRARQLGPAIQEINSLTADEVYHRLLQELPYEETRQYIPKVIDAIQLHQI